MALNPLRSEGEAFRLLLYVIAVFVAAVIVLRRVSASTCVAVLSEVGRCVVLSASVDLGASRVAASAIDRDWSLLAPCGSDHRRYLTVSLPSMPPSRWPGTVQKNVYVPGLRSAENCETPPLVTISPLSLTPLPSIAMSCCVVCGFSDLIVTWPAVGGRVGELVGEPGGGDRDVQRAVLLGGRALGLGDADVGERALVLAGDGDRAGDVGRDVAGVLALDDAGLHQRQFLASRRVNLSVTVGVRDLPVDDAGERAGAQPVQARLAERLVEVRTGDAGRSGPRERVARGAVLGEQRLAVDQVLAAIFELAAAEGERRYDAADR